MTITGWLLTTLLIAVIAQDVIITRDVVPTAQVGIVEGQDLFLRFGNGVVSDLVECRVTLASGRDVILVPGNTDDPLVRYWGSGLQEECGVQAVNIGVEDGGRWYLLSTNSSGQRIQGNFSVLVYNDTLYEDEEITIVDQSYNTLELGPRNSKYCQSTRPSGKEENLLSKPCSVILNHANRGDAGDWSARFAVPGRVQEVETISAVRVVELENLETSVTESSRVSGGLDLLCRWTTREYVRITASFCRFMRPDGVAFSLEDGVGSGDYSYHGEGLNYADNVKDCGVTIHAPDDADVGTWQCVIGVDLGTLTKGGFINVPATRATSAENRTEEIVVSAAMEVFVVNGTALKLECSANVALQYCWFQHPNMSLTSPRTTAGLGLGQCRLELEEVVVDDSGVWTCNMGVSGKVDLSVPINVYVTESSIVANDTEINLRVGGTTRLVCHTSPVGVPLQYCRFVRPDGVGFGFFSDNDVIMGRYAYAGAGLDKGECGLRLEDAVKVDIGVWSCAALPVTSKMEGRAEIIVTEKIGVIGGAGIAGIAIACIAVVALIVGIGYSQFHKRR